jgi:hypothetical protein
MRAAIASLRAAIGLVGLGVVAGVVPTGAAGLPYVALALGGASGSLVLLISLCIAGARLARPSSPTAPPRRLPLRHATPTGSAPRSM